MAELTAASLLEKVLTDSDRMVDLRVRSIVNRLTGDLFNTVQEMEITPAEFWVAADWLTRLGASGQLGLVTAGLGLDRLLDILEDERDQLSGRPRSTPRAIEGPLYVPGAPESQHHADLSEPGDSGQVLVMAGTVRSASGTALGGATVDVWHADASGRYSGFDPAQTPYHLRRRITANQAGEYSFQTKLPPGYAIPREGPTAELFAALGRHGNRPAHIHFLISAPGHRTLTTQINLPGDPFLDDDFAYATRDELVVELHSPSAGDTLKGQFDIMLQPAINNTESAHLSRAAVTSA